MEGGLAVSCPPSRSLEGSEEDTFGCCLELFFFSLSVWFIHVLYDEPRAAINAAAFSVGYRSHIVSNPYEPS